MPFYKKGQKEDLGNYVSVFRLLWWGRFWSGSSSVPSHSTYRTTRWSGPVGMGLQKADLDWQKWSSSM